MPKSPPMRVVPRCPYCKTGTYFEAAPVQVFVVGAVRGYLIYCAECGAVVGVLPPMSRIRRMLTTITMHLGGPFDAGPDD